MDDLEKTISYFKAKQVNCVAKYGQEEPRIADALEALNCFALREVENEFAKLEALEKQRDAFDRIVNDLMNKE